MLIAISAHSYQEQSKLKYFFFDSESELLRDIKENLEFNLSEYTTKFKLTDEVKLMWYSLKAPISKFSLNTKGYSPVLTSVKETNRSLIDNLTLVISENSFHFEGTVNNIEYYSDILNMDSIDNIFLHNLTLQNLQVFETLDK
jgi:hypothetical protein